MIAYGSPSDFEALQLFIGALRAGMLVAGLSDAQKASMRARIGEMIRARSNGHRFAVLTAPLNIGIGTK